MVRGRSPLQPDTLPLKAGLDEDDGTGERDPRTTSGYEGRQASSVWWQRPRETEFVTIWIGQVEVALAPLSIARGHGWREPGGTRTLIEFIYIGHKKNHAPHQDHCRSAGWVIRFR